MLPPSGTTSDMKSSAEGGFRDVRHRGPHECAGPGGLRRFLAPGLAIVLIAGSVAWIVHSLGRTDHQNNKPAIYLYCTACREIYEPRERLAGEHPRVCDKCGKRTAWFAHQCRDCGEVFPGGTAVCPTCGSGNWRMYDPKDDVRSGKEP